VSPDPIQPLPSVDGWPSVSVVLPTHNRPEPLAVAVRAILEQAYPGIIECLIVFDRQEPERPAVEVPEGRELRLLTNQRTPGPAGGYNTGALAARGEFVAICDDDDEWLPDKTRRQIEAFRRHPQASMATSGTYIVTQRAHRRVPSKELLSVEDVILTPRNVLHSSTLMVRREDFLTRIGLIDEDIPGSYAEDLEWMVRAARVGPLVAVTDPLVRISFQYSGFGRRWDLVAEALPYLLNRIPEYQRVPRSLSKVYGRMAFAHAALGHPREARRLARRSLELNWRQPLGFLAIAVSLRLVSSDAVVRLANTTGRGI